MWRPQSNREEEITKESIKETMNTVPISEEKPKVEEKQIEKKESLFNFDEEKTGLSREVYTIFGNKGEGKTAFSLNPKFFPGNIVAISFDYKTIKIKTNFYNNDKRIKVHDGKKYYNEDIDKLLKSSTLTYKYILALLDSYKEKEPDWILIDGLEILVKISEFAMRDRENLRPFQGIANMNVWKVRKLILSAIHSKAMQIAKKGVIYTTYSEKNTIIEDGIVIKQKDMPHYMDIVLYETDTVIHVYNIIKEKEIRFLYKVLNSKTAKFKTGEEKDITIEK